MKHHPALGSPLPALASALLLALTFGLPAIVPAGGGLAEVVDDRFARFFAPDDPASLASALREIETLITPPARAAALEVAARHAPGPLSERFAWGLRERLHGSSAEVRS